MAAENKAAEASIAAAEAAKASKVVVMRRSNKSCKQLLHLFEASSKRIAPSLQALKRRYAGVLVSLALFTPNAVFVLMCS